MTVTRYQQISGNAIIALVTGLIALLGMWIPIFYVLVPICLAAALGGAIDSRRYEKRGLLPSLIGAMLVVSAISTPLITRAMHDHYAYRSECLPGHHRLTFAEIIKEGEDNLAEWSDQKVCLKGYAHLSLQNDRATKMFALSPDGNTFRSMRSVLVELPEERLLGFGPDEPIAVSGRLVLTPEWDGTSYYPKYKIQDAEVRPSRCRYDLAKWTGPADGC